MMLEQPTLYGYLEGLSWYIFGYNMIQHEPGFVPNRGDDGVDLSPHTTIGSQPISGVAFEILNILDRCMMRKSWD